MDAERHKAAYEGLTVAVDSVIRHVPDVTLEELMAALWDVREDVASICLSRCLYLPFRKG